MLDRFLMATVGLTFLLGGGFITRCALDAKNLIETALFGLLGVGIGVFLIVSALCGPPG
jgi:hypothetical protein